MKLFTLDNNNSIMGSMNNMIGKILGNSQKHFGQFFEHILLRPIYHTQQPKNIMYYYNIYIIATYRLLAHQMQILHM